MPTDIIISGALGKVGREIAACALADKAVRLTACVDFPGHPLLGKDIGACIGQEAAGVSIVSDVAQVLDEKSVIIDFSSPQGTAALLGKLAGKKNSLVIGTTGIDAAGVEKIRNFGKTNPVVFSPNMSLGVNILFHLTEILASRLASDFDIEIVEAHHRFKKDAPSGTARKLGEIVASAMGKSYNEAVKNGRAGISGERPRKEIGMHAVRGGDIVGDHTVLFAALGERIELRHMAHSRATFARGAVLAAKWVSSQKPGFYSMRDVLGI